MEETPSDKAEPRDSLIKLDFTRRRRKSEEDEAPSPRRALVWAGLIFSLLLMVAGTLVTMLARQHWGLFLFLGAALMYLVCRCMTIGVLNTAPKVFSVVLLVVGAFILSRWPALSAMGAVGIACLAGALALILVGGLGYVRKSRRPGD